MKIILEISVLNVKKMTQKRIHEHLRDVLNVVPSVAKITHIVFVKTAYNLLFRANSVF